MKRLQTFIGMVLLVVAAWWLLSRLNVLPSFPRLFKEQPVTIDQTGVWVTEIKSLAQLVTVSAYDELVADSVKTLLPEAFRIPSVFPLIVLPRKMLGERKLVLIGKTTTHVGIDMRRLQPQQVQVTGDSIYLRLPKAAVLDVVLNPSDVEVFIEEGTWDNAALVQLKNKLRAMAAGRAVQKGLLTQSEAKARQVFTDFFKAAGFAKVQVDFG